MADLEQIRQHLLTSDNIVEELCKLSKDVILQLISNTTLRTVAIAYFIDMDTDGRYLQIVPQSNITVDNFGDWCYMSIMLDDRKKVIYNNKCYYCFNVSFKDAVVSITQVNTAGDCLSITKEWLDQTGFQLCKLSLNDKFDI